MQRRLLLASLGIVSLLLCLFFARLGYGYLSHPDPGDGAAGRFLIDSAPMTRRLSSVLGNSQRLDGGAMFGNAPKPVWERWIAPDARNRIPLACRALLVEEPDGRRVLLEAGIGAFFAPKLKDRFGVVEDGHVLLASLEALGLGHEDIDTVVLSHLHFDHAGGLLAGFQEGREPALLFPKATFVVSAAAWQRATEPHMRDRASFVPELNALLAACGRLRLVDGSDVSMLGPGYTFHLSQGHTPGLLLTEVEMPGGPILFAGDLVPGVPWVHLPITMGYDRFPELLIEEKAALLGDLVTRGGRLFFTHDPATALATVSVGDRGRLEAADPVEALVRFER